MTRPCRGPDYETRAPRFAPPTLSCDTQAHVFGPSARFPYAAGRGYTPPDCPVEAYMYMLGVLGIERGVIVHGSDNRVTLDGIKRMGDRCRGVAVVEPDIPDAELEAMSRGGIRGIRLSPMLKGGLGTEHLETMAGRIGRLGWHIVIHLDRVAELVELAPRLERLPVAIVIDHLGRVRGGEGVNCAGFQALLAVLRDTDHCWVKISSWYRLSDAGPPYDDMTPLAAALIATRPDRVIWGSNWPHPILWQGVMPNDGELLDQLMGWAGDEDTRRRILVDNPARLYGFS